MVLKPVEFEFRTWHILTPAALERYRRLKRKGDELTLCWMYQLNIEDVNKAFETGQVSLQTAAAFLNFYGPATDHSIKKNK